MPEEITVNASAAFSGTFKRAPSLLRSQLRGALKDFYINYTNSPNTFIKKYRPVKGLPSKEVREIRLTYGNRLLIIFKNSTLTLLDFGDHDIVSDYASKNKVKADIINARCAPDEILDWTQRQYLTFNEEEEWKIFANEADPSWLSFLDKQQCGISQSILRDIQIASKNNKGWQFHLILGGPGTGKTSILMELFTRLIEIDLYPQIVVSDEVAEYLCASCFHNIDGWRTSLLQANQNQQNADILLVDDPLNKIEIDKYKYLAQDKIYKSVVVVFDPLQLIDKFTDDIYKKYEKLSSVKIHMLNTCYRQKEVVGRAAKRTLDAIAESNAFLIDDRVNEFSDSRKLITKLSNNLKFTNPSGRSRVHLNTTLEVITQEIERLFRGPRLWTHWPPLLVVIEDEKKIVIPRAWREQFARIQYTKLIYMSESKKIKGVEFQHAYVFISRSMFEIITKGFKGSGQSKYEQRKLYRIPITRAKDSIVWFIVDN